LTALASSDRRARQSVCVKELATAELLTDQLPRVEVLSLTSVSGVDDSSDPRE